MLNLDFVRQHFPTLDQGWTLFDNAGGSVPPRGLIDAVTEFMTRWPVQLGASYALSEEATQRVAAAHDAMAAWIGAEPGTVILGPSTTRNMKMLAQALLPGFNPGDEIIITNLDHEANVGPWWRLSDHGLTVKEWRLRPETCRLELEDLDALLSERTRLVAFTHCANVVGAIHDVATITDRIHQAGALACVDGVAYAPHRPVDVSAWDVDFYSISLYKTFGPHLALLYGKKSHLQNARGQSHYFIGEDQVPYKFEPGNVSHELAAALPQIPAYFDALAAHHEGADLHPLLAEHEERLAARLLDFLTSRSNVRVLGPTTGDRHARVPTIAFAVDGRPSSEIPPLVDPHRIAIRWGDFYAPRAMQALGLDRQDGIVRVSMVHYNTLDEVDRLIGVLDGIL